MSDSTRNAPHSTLPLGALLVAGCLTLLGCSDSESGGSASEVFLTRNTSFTIAANGLVRVAERWLVFQADEFTHGPSGANFNGVNVASTDTDMNDSIAIVVDMLNRVERNLRVDVDDIAILGTGPGARVYFVVVEADDSTDWDGDGMTDDVVLLTTPALGSTNNSLQWVANLGGGGPVKMLKSSGRLYFVAAPDAMNPLMVGESAISYVDLAAPTVPTRVGHADTLLLETMEAPSLVGGEAGLLFFTLDENVESATIGGMAGVNLNADPESNDSDTTDAFVLGLLDTTDPAALARNTAQALASNAGPVRALANGSGTDWTVAFLTSESAQGPDNLNNASSPDLPGGWLPPQCTVNDTDTTDEVLAYISYNAWVADPLASDPVNTGLVGSDRVLAIRVGGKHFVGTISSEADAECNLNGDGEGQPGFDDVFRWAPVGAGTPYVTAVDELLAVKRVAGGAEGVAELGGRFVIVADEAEAKAGDDFDGDSAVDRDVVGWLNPNPTSGSPLWVFDHSPTAGRQAAATDWMAPRIGARLPLSFQEDLINMSINSGGDTDTLDSAPAFSLFDPVDDLDFPGPPVAIDAGNAGIAIAAGFAFYRVDEAADNREWSGDGLADDFVLFRTNVSTLQDNNLLGVLNALPRPSVETDGVLAAVYITDEAMLEPDQDVNNDGKKNSGFTPRYFLLP